MPEILKVAQLGQPILRARANEVAPEELRSRDFQNFLDEMVETLIEQHGVGLAAPQVFDGRRVFLAAVLEEEGADEEEPAQIEVFINPVFESKSAEVESDWEGCLSFRELLVLVPRHQSVKIRYQNRLGEAKILDLVGYFARVVQHELDHLDGVLTIDRASSTRDIIKASEIDAVEEPKKTRRKSQKD